MMHLQRNQQWLSIRLWLESESERERVKERERENVTILIPHCFMHVGYLHKLQGRLEDRGYSSTAFHRPYHRTLSSFQHCPLAPHSMQMLAACGMCAWLVGCEISEEICLTHPSSLSWFPNNHTV